MFHTIYFLSLSAVLQTLLLVLYRFTRRVKLATDFTILLSFCLSLILIFLQVSCSNWYIPSPFSFASVLVWFKHHYYKSKIEQTYSRVQELPVCHCYSPKWPNQKKNTESNRPTSPDTTILSTLTIRPRVTYFFILPAYHNIILYWWLNLL